MNDTNRLDLGRMFVLDTEGALAVPAARSIKVELSTILADQEFQAGLERLFRASEAARSKSLELLVTTDLRLYATSGAVG